MRTFWLALTLALTPLCHAQITLCPTGAVWKYLDQNVYPGNNWKDIFFNDSAWASGLAPLGFGDPEATIINGGPSNARYITTYFRRKFVVADAAELTNFAFRVRRDDGLAVYLNGFELFRDNLHQGQLTPASLAIVAIGDWDETDYFTFTMPARYLVSGTNVLAAEVHQVNATSSDLTFELELLANSSTVSVLNLIADSAAEFSTTQGSNGWFYGYFREPNFNQASFLQLETPRLYNGSRPGWTHPVYAPPWTIITTHHAAPAAPTFSGVATEYAVRRFMPTQSASVFIRNWVNFNDANQGDGILMTILKSNQAILSRFVSGGDTNGFRDQVTTTMVAGLPIDFVVAPNSNDGYDFVASKSQILEYSSQPPVVMDSIRLRPRLGTSLVDVFFNLSGPSDYGPLDVQMDISTNGSRSFDVASGTSEEVSGDIGTNVTRGVNRHIVWRADPNWFEELGGDGIIRLRASARARDVSAFVTTTFLSGTLVDLAIDAVHFTPVSMNAGQAVSVNFRVRNLNTNNSPATVARLLLSTDAIINTADTGLVPLDVTIPPLAASATSNYSVNVTVPANLLPGRYYVGVLADPNGLLNQNNRINDSGVSLTKLTVQGIGGPSLYLNPTNRAVGAEGSTVSFNIRNAGGGNLNWNASVLSGAWLKVISASNGVTGLDGATLWINSSASSDTQSRTGVVRIAAPGTVPSSVDVKITQTAASVVPAGFVFSAIGPTQFVNTPFPVTITAVGPESLAAKKAGAAAAPPLTGFSGIVALFAGSGAKVSPLKVPVVNGQWSGQASIDGSHPEMQLTARSIGISGQSGFFISKSPGDQNSSLNVVALDGNGVPPYQAPIQASIRIQSLPPLPPFTSSEQQTTPLLHATFNNLPSGRYLVQARPVGSTLDWCAGDVVSVDGSGQFRASHPYKTQVHGEGRPVLFVPGMLGSKLKGTGVPDPPLLAERPEMDPAELEIANVSLGGIPLLDDDIGEKPGWFALRRVLKTAGYEIFDVPWDWRSPVFEGHNSGKLVAWRRYLRSAIDDAKCRTGKSNVSIVAHSMGGLLVREYIQSPDYQGDIDKFAMVGTPNMGAAVCYFVWDGGDTVGADKNGGAGFYAKAVTALYATMRGNADWSKATAVARRGFIRHEIPLLGEVLPIFNFLYYGSLRGDGGVFFGPPPDQGFGFYPSYETQSLYVLNNSPETNRYTRSNGDPAKVKTKVFLAKNVATVTKIPISGFGKDGVYENGQPSDHDHTYKPNEGDGTVWGRSVTGQAGSSSDSSTLFEPETSLDGEHAALIRIYSTKIKEFLDQGFPTAFNRLAKNSIDPEVPFTNQLVVSVIGRVQPYLIDPLSNACGNHPTTGEYTNNMTNAVTELNNFAARIAVIDPADGLYAYSFRGVPGDEVDLSLQFLGGETLQEKNFKWIISTQRIFALFTLTKGVSNSIQVSALLLPPSNLRAEKVGDNTRLSWSSANDTNVSGYRIYGRRDDLPQYAFLGDSTFATFEPGHAWGTQSAGTNWTYIVVSVGADGAESYFLERAQNFVPFLARFSAPARTGNPALQVSFTNESTGPVTSWSWDFDGDGNADSTNENPSCVYGIPGSYTVSLSVNGPEGADTVTKAGYVIVGDPNQQPVFGPVRRMPGGEAQVQVSDAQNRSLFIESSTDLIDWSLLGIGTPTNGVMQFLDYSVTNNVQRFYRAVAP